MNILELKHITYAYDRTPVLNDVSMTFEDGACYAIVGPSGAGKTTLLSLMSRPAISTRIPGMRSWISSCGCERPEGASSSSPIPLRSLIRQTMSIIWRG